MRLHKIATIHQPDSKDCGPTCLHVIARYYGKYCSIQRLRELCGITREGVTMLGLGEAAASIGLTTLSARITLEQLAECMPLPCILFWNRNHFVVCYDVKGRHGHWTFRLMDPAQGKVSYDMHEMQKHWIAGKLEGEDIGIAMQIAPGPDFDREPEDDGNKTRGLTYFLRFLLPHRKTYLHLLFGSLVVMLLGYCMPFISQAVIDIGVQNRDLDFILLMMAVQLIIALSQTAIQFVQSWIALHMHTVIDLSLVESYLDKLTRMPMRFFEIKTLGDILQRIGDHGRIKAFLMDNLVGSVFSISTFIVFTTVLAVYNWQILIIFLVGNSLYVLWILAFMKYRRKIDNKMFAQSARLQNNMVQFIEGMPEIKLNGMERQKLWEWKHIQADMYKISLMGLRIGQIQSSGSLLITTATNILLSYMTARLVVSGEMTLGMMMSLSFIIGQVAGPIGSFIGLACSYQDARISLDRLNDVNGQTDEASASETQLQEIPECHDISIENVSFSYDGTNRNYALRNVTLDIPQGKMTALVGTSGSGKTTLLKMLQGFYQPQEGMIKIGRVPLSMIRPTVWRRHVGSVMQDGYIFSDTIAHNIAASCPDENIDKKRLLDAVQRMNMEEYVYSQPLNFSTKIGNEGIGLSQGQKQRILLARAVYKSPDFLLLDEATNALDTQNEREIMERIRQSFQGKTIIVAAHRLSTIRNADNIVVLEQGVVVEQGSHQQLLEKRGTYFQLIENQLEMNRTLNE